MEDQSSECMIERDKTGDVTALTAVREGCGGERNMSSQQGNESLNKLSTLNTTTQPHNLPVSLEQDIQDEEQFISWIEPPQKTTMVCAAPGSHFGIYEPLPQAMLNLRLM